MSGGAGSRRDHDRFCTTEGWEPVRNPRGAQVAHHLTYELRLPDGRVLRTRISRPPNKDSYGPGLWRHILTDQLDVTGAQFWACVRDGQLPDRGAATTEPPPRALPAGLVHQLIHLAGVPEREVAGMGFERAIEVMTAHWSRPND